MVPIRVQQAQSIALLLPRSDRSAPNSYSAALNLQQALLLDFLFLSAIPCPSRMALPLPQVARFML